MSRELELYSYVALITPFSLMVEVTVRYMYTDRRSFLFLLLLQHYPLVLF